MKGQPMDWNKILNWRLLSGSHEFPGPDGGTCINEAAIVAAGFKYNPVLSAADCPPCFSWVLSSYAISLNDNLPDDQRQELLMPFVTRLAGTADTPEIEWQRFDYIMLGLIRTVLPISLRGWKDDLAATCERVSNYDEAIAAVSKIARALDLAGTRARALDLARARALDLALALDLDLDLALALALARARARALARDLDLDLDLARNKAAVALLDGAMKIGKQADLIEQELVINRLAKIREPELSE